jgi:hypothetical protein
MGGDTIPPFLLGFVITLSYDGSVFVKVQKSVNGHLGFSLDHTVQNQTTSNSELMGQ